MSVWWLLLLWPIIGIVAAAYYTTHIEGDDITLGDLPTLLFCGAMGPIVTILIICEELQSKSDVVIFKGKKKNEEENSTGE